MLTPAIRAIKLRSPGPTGQNGRRFYPSRTQNSINQSLDLLHTVTRISYTNGDVRLVGGTQPKSGIVEHYYNGVWTNIFARELLDSIARVSSTKHKKAKS